LAFNLKDEMKNAVAKYVLLKYGIFYKGDKLGEHHLRAIPDGELIRLNYF
jgi:hypothetical protein